VETVTAPTATIVAQPVPDVSLRTLRALIADLQGAYPQAGQRVDHAAFLVLARRVERSESGAWWVGSEADPTTEYAIVGGRCTCQDFARRGQQHPCKHLLATMLYQRCERVEAEATDPSPAVVVEEVTDIYGQPIRYALTEQALAIVDEYRQRNAARCPGCGWWKSHTDLYCCGDYCDGERGA
jgi:predicted nucleic acid-binding Zn finger protein